MEQFDDPTIENQSTASSYKPPSMFQIMFDKMISDMRFVGMFSIIYGALTCITIIGAIVGVPIIIVGIRIREAADQFAIFRMTNDSTAMRNGFELQGKFFKIIKILIIISLVITVLYIIFLIVFITSGIGALMQMQSGGY